MRRLDPGLAGQASTFRRWSRRVGSRSGREIVTSERMSPDWTIDEGQLTDLAIIRRMVLKRCIYGVDKNPLTVELAKVSLWLHSFTVGAPLVVSGPPPALRRLAGGNKRDGGDRRSWAGLAGCSRARR